MSELRLYQAYGELESAYGQLLATLGLDPLPDDGARDGAAHLVVLRIREHANDFGVRRPFGPLRHEAPDRITTPEVFLDQRLIDQTEAPRTPESR